MLASRRHRPRRPPDGRHPAAGRSPDRVGALATLATTPQPPTKRRWPIRTALGLGAVALLVLGTAFFVAAGFALVAIDRTRLEAMAAEGNRAARGALEMLHRLSFHLSGAQLGITSVSVVLGYVAAPTLAQVVEGPIRSLVGARSAHGVAVALALVLATVLSMVLGELVPKNLVLARPERAVLLLAPPLRVFSALCSPIIRLANGAANAVVRWFGIEPREELDSARSLDELDRIVRSSAEEGALGNAPVTLFSRSLRFGDKTAAEALVPRLAVTWLREDATVGTLIDQALATGHSRFPVCRGDLDDVAGVVHVKDVYGLPPATRRDSPITAIQQDAFSVPETRELESLFSELRSQGTHMAIVVDEYGGTAGIVTMEDLLEEIVGEIDDEYDFGTTPVTESGTGEWLLAGTLHPDEVREACGFDMPEGEYETLAGFLLDRLGHLPETGEVIEHAGWRFEVAEMDRRRIALVRAIAPPPSAPSAPDPVPGPGPGSEP
ncbi:MAG: Magnesium and cobalt efflux protein CorC [Acidimicrobiales bacterium]|nr:Magnesium and cobalt efflux protein CorC [Acidimicrobiales bacterium]